MDKKAMCKKVVSLFSYCLLAVSSRFSVFLLARVFGGLSKGNTGLSIAILTDVTEPAKRGHAMAAVGIAYSLGFLIGPVLGAGFAKLIRLHPDMFFQAPALAGVLITGLEILLLLITLSETLPKHKRMSSVGRSISDVVAYIAPPSLFSFTKVSVSGNALRSLRKIGSVYFVYLLLFSGVEFTLTFLVHERFNYDSMQQGKMFFFMGVMMALVQGGYVRRLKPGAELRTAQMGILCLMVSFIVCGLARNVVFFYCGLVLFSCGSGTVVPCLTTLASQYGNDDQKGTVLGIFRSLGALARAAGPVAACSLYWYHGPLICLVVMTAAMSVPLVLLRLVRHQPEADKIN